MSKEEKVKEEFETLGSKIEEAEETYATTIAKLEEIIMFPQ